MEHEKLNTEETANSGLAAVSGSFDLNIEARKIIVNKYPYLPFDQWGYFEDMFIEGYKLAKSNDR